MDAEKQLNLHDKLVLESIFNPNLPLEDVLASETDSSNNDLSSNLSATNNKEDIEWKRLESEAIQLAEKEQFDDALVLFKQALELQPNNAASYNNRAQLLRLKGDIEGAKADLDVAIEKSQGVGTAACQAFTQRAMIRRLQGDDQGCREDFQKAADLGSKFAKQQLVFLNPYAALCNQMLSQMMNKLAKGEPTDSGEPAA